MTVLDTPAREIAWTRWYLGIALVFGAIFLVALPPGASPDERSHLLRVVTIADGWWVPPRHLGVQPGYELDKCLSDYLVTMQLLGRDVWAPRFETPRDCSGRMDAREVFLGGIIPMERYSPVPYLPAVVGYRVGSVVGGFSGGVYGARLVQFLSALALFAVAIRVVPWGKPYLTAVALLPTVIEVMAGISGDAVTIGAAFLSCALVLRSVGRALRLGQRTTTGELLSISGLFLVLALCKSVYLPMVFLSAILPTAAFGSLRRRIVWVVGSIVVAVGAGLAWTSGVVEHLLVPNAARARVQDQPTYLVTLMWNTFTDWGSVKNTISGFVGPLSPTRNGPYPVLGVVVAVLVGLVWLRLCDPAPRWLGARWDPGPDEGGGGRVVGRVEHRLGIALVVAVAVAVFVLTGYGLVVTGFVRGRDMIWGLQGRYLLPIFPLALFGVDPSRQQRAPTRMVVWLLPASTLLLTYWTVVLLRYFNHWLGGS